MTPSMYVKLISKQIRAQIIYLIWALNSIMVGTCNVHAQDEKHLGYDELSFVQLPLSAHSEQIT